MGRHLAGHSQALFYRKGHLVNGTQSMVRSEVGGDAITPPFKPCDSHLVKQPVLFSWLQYQLTEPLQRPGSLVEGRELRLESINRLMG